MGILNMAANLFGWTQADDHRQARVLLLPGGMMLFILMRILTALDLLLRVGNAIKDFTHKHAEKRRKK